MYDELLKVLINLNIMLHRNETEFNYHMRHCYLMEKYMNIIAEKYNKFKFNKELFPIIAWGHDLLKDRENKFSKFYQKNSDNMKRFQLTKAMKDDLSVHAYRSAEFLSNYPLNITDGKILYPILFHSVPIVEIMEKILSKDTREYINITILADKLSSNYWRIYNSIATPCDLSLYTFGANFYEFNYMRGIYVARLLDIFKYANRYSLEATEYYRKLYDENQYIKLGEKKIWEKRKNPLFKTQSNISIMLLKDVSFLDWNIWMDLFSEKEKSILHM